MAEIDEPKVTLKIDKRGRLCAWYGNVQKLLVYDRFNELVVANQPALCRLSGVEKMLVLGKMDKRHEKLLDQGFAVVLSKKESFL